MPQVAQQSSSSQLCRSLLLGNFARLQAMPVLEIWADDVSCSHGVAVTDLDENAMFYLSARGINRAVRALQTYKSKCCPPYFSHDFFIYYFSVSMFICIITLISQV